jgi:DNA polymerase
MESALDFYSARELLQWQIELGATEAVSDTPVDRYTLEAAPPKQARSQPPAPVRPKEIDPAEEAQKAAAAAAGLPSLREALAAFEHCPLKKGARNLVFADGRPGARVMVIGEAPNREEDRAGKPFVGQEGLLLDRMLAAIGLSREENAYLSLALPWRPRQGGEPAPEEVSMLQPFLRRHVELAQPELLILMGNVACQAVLGKRGITRLRGTWAEAWGRPVLPMLHPEQLMRQPGAKRQAWADLLMVKARLQG